jgi:hypothetical protein
MIHEVLEEAREAPACFEEHADGSECPGRLSVGTFPQVKAAGLPRLMQPKGLGGALAADHGGR